MLDTIYSTLGEIFGIHEISGTQWRLGNPLPSTLLAFILIAALVFAVWSYRREQVSKFRGLLMTLRLLGVIILLLLLLQPSLSLQHEEKGESRVYAVLDRSQSMSITDHESDKNRWEYATSALVDEVDGIVKKLEADHVVEILTVGDDVTPSSVDDLAGQAPDAKSSAIGLALDELKEKEATAVVLLSDMAWNAGDDPVNVAGRLGNRGIAVFPIPIGQSNSPDASILSANIRDRVFPGEDLPLKVQISSTPQLEGMTTDLVVRFDDDEVARHPVTLSPGQQVIEIPMKGPNLKGRADLSLELEALDEEVSTVNNLHERSVTFLEQKVKVLYVEGAPRWEYRYLRTVLMRDERLDVKFLMTQGDPDLATYSPEYIAEFPAVGQSTLDFDMVILGDVPASYFETSQMEWMVQQVSRLGASLLMLGGSSHSPQSYVGTPLEPLLPINVEGSSWVPVTDDVVASPTDEGLAGQIALLGVEADQARKLWAQISPLYDAPPVSARPGANVLVTLGRKRVDGLPYPLVAWQRYGSGKSMFVGTELLWRLRKTVGRRYHESFWSTSIQFMALSRLLGGNERITLEADRNRYPVGDSFRLHADVLNDYLEPVEADSYTIVVKKVDDDEFEPVELTLRPAQGTPGFYQGFYLPPSVGEYGITALGDDEEQANTLTMSVYEESLEMRRPEARIDTAEQIARQSSGAVVSLDQLASLPEKIEQQRPRYQRELSIRLWDHPALYILLLLATCWEWWLRRRLRLV